MTVQQLQYVLEVHKAGSITQAAKNLFVTPSSVSAAIASLEKELGYPVFARSWQGVQLTPKGKQVVKHADYICRRLELIEKELLESGQRDFRIITSSHASFDRPFVQVIREFRNDRSVRRFIKLNMGNRFEAMDAVASEDADLMALCAISISLVRFETNVKKRRLEMQLRKVIPAVILIGPGHHLYHKEDLTPEDFRDEVILDTPSMAVIDAGLLKPYINISPYRAILVKDRETRREMVRDGLGYMLTAKYPEHIARRYGFRQIPVPGLDYHLITVINPNVDMRPETARFLELLDEEAADI